MFIPSQFELLHTNHCQYDKYISGQLLDTLRDLNASPHSGKFLAADLMQYNLWFPPKWICASQKLPI